MWVTEFKYHLSLQHCQVARVEFGYKLGNDGGPETWSRDMKWRVTARLPLPMERTCPLVSEETSFPLFENPVIT